MPEPKTDYAEKYPGVPGLILADVRKILRTRRSSFDAHLTLCAPMIALGCDAFSADRHLRAMAEAGYLIHDSQLPLTRDQHAWARMDRDADRLKALVIPEDAVDAVQSGVPHWYLTPVAQQLCVQKLLKRMDRKEAEKLLERFLNKVRAVNAAPGALMRITRVQMFGSMLDETRESYGDLDFYITQAPDLQIWGTARAELVSTLAEEGYRTGGFLARYSQPEQVARTRSEKRNKMWLEKLGQRVSLMSQSPSDLGAPWVDIYTFDVETCRESDEVSASWRRKARELCAMARPAQTPRAKGAVTVATIETPRLVPSSRKEVAYREPIRSREIAMRTARLMAVQPQASDACHHCGGRWCEHRDDIGVADVEEGSNELCLLDLEASLRQHPLAHPIVEMRRCVDFLQSYPEEAPDVSMGHALYEDVNFIALEKGGIGLGRTPGHAGGVYEHAPFAIKAGTFAIFLQMGSASSTEGFVAYMRLAHALQTLWNACAFSGGGDARVILDLAAPGFTDLDLSRLAVVGKFARAARPLIKSFETAPPFPEDYAAARIAARTEHGSYRPGIFRVEAQLDQRSIEVAVHCHALRPEGEDLDWAKLGQEDGRDPETREARDKLVAALQPVAHDLRALPGFVKGETQYWHRLPYPR